MTSSQKVKALTAAVDGLILIITTIIVLMVNDEKVSTTLIALFAGLQPVLITMIVALTSTENTTIRAEASKTIARNE